MENITDPIMLEGRKKAFSRLGNVLVLGLGVSGKAVVEYLAPMTGDRVDSLTVLCGAESPANSDWAASFAERMSCKSADASVTFIFDEADAFSCLPQGAAGFDLCIVSPGISVFSEMYVSGREASDEIIAEIELAWRESLSGSIWIAVTGTNGKTTTTSLIQSILASAGLDAKAVGNIGEASISQVARDVENAAIATPKSSKTGDARPSPCIPVYVAEVSSFQLASIDNFTPEAAVMLGIRPDHIEWHKTHEHYVRSKMRLIDNMASADYGTAIMDATGEEVRRKIAELGEKRKDGRTCETAGSSAEGFGIIPIGGIEGVGWRTQVDESATNAAFVDDRGMLEVDFDGIEHIFCPAGDLGIKGDHNVVNALAASAVAVALSLPDGEIADSLKSFKPLEHRIEPSGKAGRISFFNDSKATNVDSAVCAIRSFGRSNLIVMLGGHDKMTPLEDLVEACRVNADTVICYGEARDRFSEAMSPLQDEGILVLEAGGMDEAFEAAVDSAEAADGDDVVILLSPACSSYDEFNCFEERGDRFKSLAKEYIIGRQG